jgi:hypothetical protein
VFRIVNVPTENLHPLIMIECPRLLFPFAREVIATSVRDGGFPPLMLDPCRFCRLDRDTRNQRHIECRGSRDRSRSAECYLIGLSIDEWPEEVTDMQRSAKGGGVVSSKLLGR